MNGIEYGIEMHNHSHLNLKFLVLLELVTFLRQKKTHSSSLLRHSPCFSSQPKKGLCEGKGHSLSSIMIKACKYEWGQNIIIILGLAHPMCMCVCFCVCILQNKMLDDIVVVVQVSTILLQSLKISQQQPFRNVMSHLQTMKLRESHVCVCVCV